MNKRGVILLTSIVLILVAVCYGCTGRANKKAEEEAKKNGGSQPTTRVTTSPATPSNAQTQTQPTSITRAPNELPSRQTSFANVPPPFSLDTSKTNMRNADAVAVDAAKVLFAYDTKAGITSSVTKAKPYLTTAESKILQQNWSNSVGFATWENWKAHQGYVVPKKLERAYDDQPPDQPANVYRMYTVTLAPVGRDKWLGDELTVLVTMSLKKNGSAWKVDQFSAEPIEQ